MTSLAATLVLASLLAQPPAAPTAPAAPAPAAPAAASKATTAGPWVVGEPKFYRVEENSEDVSFGLANPEKKNERKTTASYTVKFIPRALEAAGGKQTFEMSVVELKIASPTPIGEMKFDSTAKEAPKDQVSVAFSSVLKQMLGVPVTLSVADGKLTDVKGNEALTEGKAAGAAIVAAFFSDAAISERFAWCVTAGNGAAKIEPGATWPVDTKADFRKMMTVELPTNATVKGVKDGLATIALAPRDGAKMTLLAAVNAAGKPSGTVKENLNAGELVWSTAENRLLSGTYTAGYTVTFDTGKMQGQQRVARTFKASRADAPAAK